MPEVSARQPYVPCFFPADASAVCVSHQMLKRTRIASSIAPAHHRYRSSVPTALWLRCLAIAHARMTSV